MTDQCREAFGVEAMQGGYNLTRHAILTSDYQSPSTQAALGFFQAGWNARPGVTVPVEVVAVIKANEERTAAAIASPFDQARFSAANLQLMEAVDAMCDALKGGEK